MDIVWVRGSYDDNTEGWLQSQFFPACAQIEVVSDEMGSLPEGFHIPEDIPRMPGASSFYFYVHSMDWRNFSGTASRC
jgi:hypothetical protein